MKTHFFARYIMFVLACLFLNSILFARDDSNAKWELEKSENNIKVYTRYKNGSDFKEFKVETTVHANLNELAAEILNVSSYPDWITDCYRTEVLSKKPDKYFYYIQFEAPWPVSNRDIVIEATIEKKEGKSFSFTMQGLPEYMDAREEVVRMPFMKGYWQLTKNNNETVNIVHQVHAEPGGKLPSWLANATVVDGPFKTVTKLVERASY